MVDYKNICTSMHILMHGAKAWPVIVNALITNTELDIINNIFSDYADELGTYPNGMQEHININDVYTGVVTTLASNIENDTKLYGHVLVSIFKGWLNNNTSTQSFEDICFTELLKNINTFKTKVLLKLANINFENNVIIKKFTDESLKQYKKNIDSLNLNNTEILDIVTDIHNFISKKHHTINGSSIYISKDMFFKDITIKNEPDLIKYILDNTNLISDWNIASLLYSSIDDMLKTLKNKEKLEIHDVYATVQY